MTDPAPPTAVPPVVALYRRESARRIAFIAGMAVIVLLAAVLACGIGTVSLSPQDAFLAVGHAAAVSLHDAVHAVPGAGQWYDAIPFSVPAPSDPQAELIVVGFRLPRILLAILTGISLAVAGTVMQGVLRNPLVSPFTLGLSSAASFGAALAIVLGPGILGTYFALGGNSFIVVAAFLCGWLSMVLVYGISRSRGVNQATLILSGVVIGYIFSAGLTALQYVSSNEKLRDLMVWLMGGMWGASWTTVLLLLPLTLVPFVLLELKAWDFNALASGDDVAKNLGINVHRLRLFGLLVSTFAASCCLAFTGIIGFVGLMAPHITRMLIGNDHRYLIPGAALTGAAILLISDTAARTILSPVEIPVGVIMYVIGGIFFLFLILRSRGRGLY